MASENLDLLANTAEEQKAAVEWVKKQALLDESKTVLSRRDVTVALYRLAGAPHAELPATSPYADVAPNDPDYAAYIWARQKGITFGWADGKFHPDAPPFDPVDGGFPVQVSEGDGSCHAEGAGLFFAAG